LMVNDQPLQARHFVIATGTRTVIPEIPGLDKVDCYTYETIFDLPEKPKHLLIIGGSAAGCEMAQAFAELDVPVTLIEKQSILQNYDAELVAVVREQLLQDGVSIYENFHEERVELRDKSIVLAIRNKENIQFVTGSHLLLATGRAPAVEGLDLAAANIQFNESGIQVDSHLRTSNRRVFALGDVVGGYHFMHAATYQAEVVVKNAFQHWPMRVNYAAMPMVSYTSPELAQVGMAEQEAIRRGIKHQVLRLGFANNDRALVEHEEAGAIKVLIDKKGVVLGAGIVGAEASELIVPWILAIQNNMKVDKLAALIVPYPTRSDISKQVARLVKPRASARFYQRFAHWITS